ncbi:MAG: hypothetical protein JW955_23930, partial [Sedimentisphaerales bacterium]|nr:hypothetical protein [Sedimentisphaerales bacterium]
MWKKLAILICVLLMLCLASSAWAGTLGHWKFDEGSGTAAKDSSSKANHGKLLNGPTWVAGQLNKAIKFDGADDYVDVPHSASLNPTTGKVTVCAWINAARHRGPTGDDWQGVLAKGGSPRIYSLYTEASGSLHFSTGVSGAYIGTLSSGKVPLNEWVHVAAVVDNEHRYYINGEPAGVSGSGATVPAGSTANFTIGRTDESNREFQGMIDDVWLFDVALTAEEVKALFNGNPPRWPKAVNPAPADKAQGVTMPLLKWESGDSAQFHKVLLGTTPDLGPANVVAARLTQATMYAAMASEPGTTYYWRVDEIEADLKTVWEGDVWSFTLAPVTAFAPIPADGALYQGLDVDLAWMPGQNAFGHEVYFSANQEDVANRAEAAFQGSLVDTMLDLPPLALETTYYWAVDEIDAFGDKQVGDVWSFTTTIPGLGFAKRELWMNSNTGTTIADIYADARYPGSPTDVNDKMPNFESPADIIGDNYIGKLSAWLHVPVAGEYTFWVASDDQSQLFLGPDPDSAAVIASVDTWTNAQEWDKEPSQQSKPITLEAGRYYLMMHWKEGGGGDSGSAAWQGAGVPNRELIAGSYLMPFEALWAYGPRPRNGAVDTTQILELKWTAGTRAATHQIYFSDDPNAVADGTAYRGQQPVDNTTFNPGTLEFGKTYYWRVDEVNPAEADSPWTGAVWSFTTANFIVVDDFEDYVDDVEGRIFQTWIDGWGYTEPAPGNPGNGTGSAVGYGTAPFAEQTIVKTGRQSMPLAYNNADSPYYSQTDRTFDTPMNWTVNGMETLSLQVRGYPQPTSVAVTETGGKMTLTGAGEDIWGTSDEFTYAYKTLNGDGSILAKVVSNGTGSNTWAKGGVMIRDSLDGQSASAQMCMTGSAGNGAVFQNRASAGLNMGDNDATSNTQSAAVIAPPFWVKIERFGDTFTGYTSADGTSWTFVGTQDVVMTAPVYIGLCVTSHAAGEDRTFQFEGIKTTGSVTGQWQGVVIDSPLYNSAQDLYVVVTDSSNKSATVTNATAVNAADWTEALMPLSSFTGVNM